MIKLDRNTIGIGALIIIVIVSVAIIFIANRFDEQGKLNKELSDAYNPAEDDDKNANARGTGGSTEKYDWDQTMEEVDVVIPLDKFDPIPSTRELDISIKQNHLRVTIRRELYIDGDFYEKIRSEDSYWTLEREVDRSVISLSLIKLRPAESKSQLWACVLKGDPQIMIPFDGPTVETLDPTDSAAVKRAVSAVNSRVFYLCPFCTYYRIFVCRSRSRFCGIVERDCSRFF